MTNFFYFGRGGYVNARSELGTDSIPRIRSNADLAPPPVRPPIMMPRRANKGGYRFNKADLFGEHAPQHSVHISDELRAKLADGPQERRERTLAVADRREPTIPPSLDYDRAGQIEPGEGRRFGPDTVLHRA